MSICNDMDLSNEAFSSWNFYWSNYYPIFYVWRVMLSGCKCIQMTFGTKWPPPWESVPLWQCLSQDTRLVKRSCHTHLLPWRGVSDLLVHCQSHDTNLLLMLFNAMCGKVMCVYVCVSVWYLSVCFRAYVNHYLVAGGITVCYTVIMVYGTSIVIESLHHSITWSEDTNTHKHMIM